MGVKMEKQTEQTEEQKKDFRTTNKEFANSNEDFKKACSLSQVKPTVRQASKFRMKKGKAFKST